MEGSVDGEHLREKGNASERKRVRVADRGPGGRRQTNVFKHEEESGYKVHRTTVVIGVKSGAATGKADGGEEVRPSVRRRPEAPRESDIDKAGNIPRHHGTSFPYEIEPSKCLENRFKAGSIRFGNSSFVRKQVLHLIVRHLPSVQKRPLDGYCRRGTLEGSRDEVVERGRVARRCAQPGVHELA